MEGMTITPRVATRASGVSVIEPGEKERNLRVGKRHGRLNQFTGSGRSARGKMGNCPFGVENMNPDKRGGLEKKGKGT